jgi:hypothetical protein
MDTCAFRPTGILIMPIIDTARRLKNITITTPRHIGLFISGAYFFAKVLFQKPSLI